MQATANSNSVNSNRRVIVSRLSVVLMPIKFSVVEPTIVIRRWPAVILAVSRTPRAAGRINRLIVSIRVINGIRGPGDPSGSM